MRLKCQISANHTITKFFPIAAQLSIVQSRSRSNDANTTVFFQTFSHRRNRGRRPGGWPPSGKTALPPKGEEKGEGKCIRAESRRLSPRTHLHGHVEPLPCVSRSIVRLVLPYSTSHVPPRTSARRTTITRPSSAKRAPLLNASHRRGLF